MSKHIATVAAPRAATAMGAVGALVGGVVAAANNYDKVSKHEMTREEAVKNTLREAGTTGLATAAATVVVGAVGGTGLLALAGMVFVAAGTKRAVDRLIDQRPSSAKAPALAVATAEPAAEPLAQSVADAADSTEEASPKTKKSKSEK